MSLIEIRLKPEQMRHVRHAPDVPRVHLPVPALTRSLVLEEFLDSRAQRCVRVAQVVLDGVLHLGRQVVVGQGAPARV